jgi:hypothetical protein
MALFAAIGIVNLQAQMPISTPPNYRAAEVMKELNYNAVPTLSTEARYSAGLLGSYVDDFIDVNYYDPTVKNFLFLGGFPQQDNSSVDRTDYLTQPADYPLSVGLAHSFEKFYLGFYFGGNLVNAEGWSDPEGAYQAPIDGKKKSDSSSSAVFKTAILLGTPAIGGIRLDVNDRTLGLKWGTTVKEKIHPHVDLGISFPVYEENAYMFMTDKRWSGGHWLVGGGLYYDLNDTSTLDAALSLGGHFGSHGETINSSGAVTKYSNAGTFGVILSTGLKNVFTPVDGISLGFKPALDIALWGQDANGTNGDTKINGPVWSFFEVDLGIAAGISARLPGKLNKFTLVSGVALNVFDWYTGRVAGGEGTAKVKPYSSWAVTGISWDANTVGSNSLGLGLVFAPTSSLSLGFGLNAILDNLVLIDLVQMTVTPGQFFVSDQPFGNGTNGGLFGGLFTAATIDLTLSYKL